MGVGTSVKRLDAIQKVTGSAKYVEDLIPLDALHMEGGAQHHRKRACHRHRYHRSRTDAGGGAHHYML